MPKARVFVSYDFDNDKTLKEFLVGQAKKPDSPFEIIDWSLKEAAPSWDWERQAEERIKRSDIFCVIAGTRTCNAPGVKKEIVMVDRLNKLGYNIKKFQLIGYSDKDCPRVEGGGVRIAWSWENLKEYFRR